MGTKSERSYGLATRAIHAGQSPDPMCGAVMTPIFQTSTYAQPTPGEPINGYEYARSQNPTRTALEANIASLEGGKHGRCFASGSAALDAILHLLSSGDHVVLSDDVYGGTFRCYDKIFKQLGIQFTPVDMTDLDATAAAFESNSKLVWAETPTNPLLKVVDLAAIAELSKAKGTILVVDNTFASPVLQNPLALGADIVSHSTTKYIGGHSDVIGGALVTNDDELAHQLWFIQNSVGAVPSPHDCFLTLRSTKTLPLRMERHCDNAKRVAEFLCEQDIIEKVVYPGLENHPQHAVAAKQMKGFGGMITMYLKGGLEPARKFLESVELFLLAESLGGVESLIEHPAIMTHASVPKEQREKIGLTDGLVRLSVGIEDVEDLIDDLSQALAAAR